MKHVGTITTPSGTYDLYDHYPQPGRRDYKITSAVPQGHPTRGISFTCEASFERWLEARMVPVQQNLFGVHR